MIFDYHYTINKIFATLSGIAGVIIFSYFYVPQNIKEKSLFAKGMILGSVGTFVPLIFTGSLLRWMGLDETDFEYICMGGFIIGMFSPMILHFAGNFGKKRVDRDIVEVINEIRGGGNKNDN